MNTKECSSCDEGKVYDESTQTCITAPIELNGNGTNIVAGSTFASNPDENNNYVGETPEQVQEYLDS